ncbi:MAG: hypothetical protein ACI4LP_06550 [Anaerovoracaceae bacterium]
MRRRHVLIILAMALIMVLMSAAICFAQTDEMVETSQGPMEKTEFLMKCSAFKSSSYVIYDGNKNEADMCTVSFNAEKTAQYGTLFGMRGDMLYIEINGIAVFDIVPKDGYKVEMVEASFKSISNTGKNEYTLAEWYMDEKIKIYCDEVPHNYTFKAVNSKRGHEDIGPYNTLELTPEEGCYVADVVVNGESKGAIRSWHITEGDHVVVYYAKIGETWQETQTLDESGRKEEKPSEPDKVLSEGKNADIISGIKATTIKASTVNVVGGKIRVSWKKSAGYKVDYYQVFRSTKKTSGYGTKPFYQSKTGNVKSYLNSKSVKKGTRYYYKVRGVRIIDGKKYYTKWSNIANRTAR